MGYVTGYRYDVFISYARDDDDEDMPGSGKWVSVFQQYFERALRRRLQGGGELEVFFDRRSTSPNDNLAEFEAAARQSAIFVSICSPSYVSKDYPMKEFNAFCEAAMDEKRLFVAEILPLDSEESYPGWLRTNLREAFMIPTSDVGGTMMTMPPQHDEYGKKINELAERVRAQLLAMQVVTDVRLAAGVSGPAAPNGKRVMLGQVTDDLELDRDQVRRHLEQFGHDVYPKGYMRQDGAGFVEDVTGALHGAEMFVQLLGPNRGRVPPDLPEGYLETQILLAKEAGVQTMQWRSAELQLDQVPLPEHRDLLTSETVVTSGLEAFKSMLQDELSRPAIKPDAKRGDESNPTVFIHADVPDLDYARQVRSEFRKQGFLAEITLRDPGSKSYKEHLKELLVECDGLVLLYGDTNELWPSKNLRYFNHLRAKRAVPPKLIAVYVGPPEEKEKDLGIDMPGLRVVGSRKAWQEEAIKELIESFGASL